MSHSETNEKVASDDRSWSAGQFSTGQDRKFALLEDVFKTFPTIPINIEVKVEDDTLIEKVNTFYFTFVTKVFLF